MHTLARESRTALSDDSSPLPSDATILCIDPGLDAAGLAVYSLTGYTGSSDVTALARAFVTVETARTLPSDPLPFRLQVLSERVAIVCQTHRPARVYIEQPRIAGTYARNRQTTGRDGMAAQMAKLHMAMGAMIAAAMEETTAVTMVNAPAMSKDNRHLLAISILRHHEQLHRPGEKAQRLPSKDALDAVWLGAQQLTGEIAMILRRRPVS